MPELPEVQVVVNDLNAAGLPGRIITRARVYWPRTVAGMSPATFSKTIRLKQVMEVSRRGKFIHFHLSDGWHLFVHLRMSGSFDFVSPSQKRDPHQHILLDFNNQRQLRFRDTRKFGRFYLVKDETTVIGRLGPEPLDKSFSAKQLAKALRTKNRLLKPLLLDQSFLAGLGNIYVDEALWEAGIHPLRKSALLSEEEAKRLHRAIRRILRRGLKNFGTTLGRG